LFRVYTFFLQQDMREKKLKVLIFLKGQLKKLKVRNYRTLDGNYLSLKITGLKSFPKINSILFTLMKYYRKIIGILLLQLIIIIKR
jgi:hypothetical protein